MAPSPLVMPKLGLTMTEGVVAEWVVRPGQRVATGDVLFVVETEKTTTDITAQADGVITEIVVAAGEKVPVGAVIARWSPGDEAHAVVAPPPRPEAHAAHTPDPLPREAHAPITHAPRAGRVIATPLARRLARERGVDLRRVTGTGPNGRIKAGDVPLAPPAARPEAPAGAPSAPPGEVFELTPFHLAMARRVSQAKREIPHFYVSADAEVSFLDEYRRKLNEIPGAARVSLNHLVVKAVGQALVEHPAANVIWQGERLLRLRDADVGFAVATDRGVAVPMLRDAGRLSLRRLVERADALAERARQGRLAEADVGGGAIAISNLGMYGAASVSPIINPPHSAILGVGAVRDVFRPGADRRPQLCRELGLVLACDHRVFDGVAAMAFLNVVVALLQNPLRFTPSSDERNE